MTFPPRATAPVGDNFDKVYPKKGIEATPGFELGKKDLQSPALPLGHAAKTTQNRQK